MPTERPPHSFRAKLTALAVALVSVPLIVAGLSLRDVNTDTVKTSSRELQLAILEDVARTIDEQLNEAEDAVTAVAGALGDDAQPAEARLGMALALVESSRSLDQVAVYGADGKLIDRIREDKVAPAGAEVLPPGLAGPGVRLGAVELVDGEPRVPVAVPIFGRGRRLTGTCLALVSLRPIQERVERIAEARFPGGAGSLFVLDEQHRVIAHPDREQAATLARADAGVLDWVDPGSLVADVARSGEYKERDGSEMVGSIVRLGKRPWTVVAQIRRDVAYASLRRMERTTLAILGGSLGLSVLVALGFAARLARPVRELSVFADKLAERRFDQRIELKTNDELSLLARAMNGAAAELAESEARIREEVAIRSDLGRYLPVELVEKVVKREQDMALGGARRAITVLFADVVGFTPLTDRLGAVEVVSLLNELFTILTEIVFRHGGTVDKFMGDCVMAIWGAPTAQEDHARRALAAATDMLSWLEAGNAAWEARLGVRIELAIGVNSGDAIVGNVGSETRMEYTAIGDVVNVAARLESIARPQQILATSATRGAAGAGFEFVDLGEKDLPGRSAPLRLFEVRG
jgi:class 3 adenylate cyclase